MIYVIPARRIPHKKAASPMIATIVLLVFALTIGFLLVNIDDYINYDNDVCSNAYEINVVVVKDGPRVCIQSINQTHSCLSFLLENNAKTDVYGLYIKFIGDSNENPIYLIRDYNTTIRSSGVVHKRYTYPDYIGNFQQARIHVYSKIDTEYGSRHLLCTKPSVIIDSFPECT